MASKEYKTTIWGLPVVYCGRPTELDRTGCDGLYIKEIIITPIGFLRAFPSLLVYVIKQKFVKGMHGIVAMGEIIKLE